MATLNQELHDVLFRRVKRRRLILIAVFGLAAILWGPRAAIVAVDGWVKSSQVLDHQREIDQTRARLASLKQEVDYGDTSTGKDVEAKRRFGVGPADEIWITVDAEPLVEETGPLSIADRLNCWLCDVGAEFTGRMRVGTAVIRYWVGLDEVEYGVETTEVEALDDEDAPASTAADPESAVEAEDGEE